MLASTTFILTLQLFVLSEQPEPVLLVYEGAPQSCPAEKWFRDATAERLGFPPWDEGAQKTLHLRIRRTQNEFSARIQLRIGEEILGERRMTSKESCADFADSVVLAMSIAIDPFLLLRETSAPEAPPPPLKVQTTEIRVLKEERDETKYQMEVGGAVSGGFGLAPGPNFGTGFLIGVRSNKNFLFLADLNFQAPGILELEDEQSEVYLMSGGASFYPCGHLADIVELCAAIGVGFQNGGGSGTAEAVEFTLPSVALGVRLAAGYEVAEGMRLSVYSRIMGALVRPQLVGAESGRILWEPPPVGGDLGLAFLWEAY